MAESIKITEEMKFQDLWYKQAREMTEENLPEFVHRLMSIDHDYGTICHAITAAAIGAAWAVERGPHGGITGFQAGAIMWLFMQHWNGIEGPARLLKYEDLLYPQYDYKFNTISQETWDSIKGMAEKKLLEKGSAHPEVLAHWQSIKDGVIPFGLTIDERH